MTNLVFKECARNYATKVSSVSDLGVSCGYSVGESKEGEVVIF